MIGQNYPQYGQQPTPAVRGWGPNAGAGIPAPAATQDAAWQPSATGYIVKVEGKPYNVPIQGVTFGPHRAVTVDQTGHAVYTDTGSQGGTWVKRPEDARPWKLLPNHPLPLRSPNDLVFFGDPGHNVQLRLSGASNPAPALQAAMMRPPAQAPPPPPPNWGPRGQVYGPASHQSAAYAAAPGGGRLMQWLHRLFHPTPCQPYVWAPPPPPAVPPAMQGQRYAQARPGPAPQVAVTPQWGPPAQPRSAPLMPPGGLAHPPSGHERAIMADPPTQLMPVIRAGATPGPEALRPTIVAAAQVTVHAAAAAAVGGPSGVGVNAFLQHIQAEASRQSLGTVDATGHLDMRAFQAELETSMDKAMGAMKTSAAAAVDDLVARGQVPASDQGKELYGYAKLPQDNAPMVVLTDIHGRSEDVVKALEKKYDGPEPELKGQRVIDLLDQGKINVVCLGDLIHSESRGTRVGPEEDAMDRWRQAQKDHGPMDGTRTAENREQFLTSPSMRNEATEDLRTMKVLLDLKARYPERFHVTQGDHDSVNRTNYFKAGVFQGTLFHDWMQDTMGSGFVQKWEKMENHMPLVVYGPNGVVSHAAPGTSTFGSTDEALTKTPPPPAQIPDPFHPGETMYDMSPLSVHDIARKSGKAFFHFVWTDNTEWSQESLPHHQEQMQTHLRALGLAPSTAWLIGHRPVETGDSRPVFDGMVQFNNAQHMKEAVVQSNGQLQSIGNVSVTPGPQPPMATT